jgi:hypothetical protein
LRATAIHHINAKNSPPASFRQSLGVHPPHIAHANQPDGEVFHSRRNAGGLSRSHCALLDANLEYPIARLFFFFFLTCLGGSEEKEGKRMS